MRKGTNNIEKTFLEKNFIMDKEQILQIVKEYFKYDGICDDGSCFKTKYCGDFDAFVKFAEAIRQNGYDEGYDDGFNARDSLGG